MPNFTPDDIARMVANPFYAITIAPPLAGERGSASLAVEGVDDWLARNAAALGTPAGDPRDGHEAEEVWLRRLLEVLRTDTAAADPANPARAVAIAPIFAVEHEPLITEAMWVRSNIKLMRELGALAWLATLLRVLQGEYVAADEADDPEGDGEDGADATDPRQWTSGQRPPTGRGRPTPRDPHAHRRRRRP